MAKIGSVYINVYGVGNKWTFQIFKILSKLLNIKVLLVDSDKFVKAILKDTGVNKKKFFHCPHCDNVYELEL